MRTALALLASLAVGAVVALAALVLVHRGIHVGPAVASATVGTVLALLIRPAWSALPPWVSRWLDLGVVVVASLLGAVGHGLSYGPMYVVARWTELSALFGAAGLLSVAVATLVYTHSRLAEEVAAQQRRFAELERRALESRMSALSAQINPHFLFNTLNALAEVVHQDEDLAEDLITDLAAMMRHALESSARLVPLSEELEGVRRLLRIERARLGERLRVDLEADDIPPVLVPGLLVQPLVENAVRHGVATRAEGGRVGVRVVRDGRRVRVLVTDDGPGLPADVAAELAGAGADRSATDRTAPRGTAGAGGGLRNAAERVRLAFPDGSGRLIHDPAAPGTHLCLDLPFEEPR